MTKSVLFICLGNICRSPIAEAVFRHEVDKKKLSDKFVIDSAALASYHIGGRADDRALSCLKERGITCTHIVRQVTKEDFNKFDFIFGMDEENMRGLNRLKPKDCRARVQLLGEYDPEKQLIIEDPYYGHYEGFVTVYDQCMRCCAALLSELTKS